MNEVVNKNKYLDFSGLKKYDELIKALIKSGDDELAKSIADLNAKIGDLNFESSDGKSLAEIVDDIYGALAELVSDHDALEKDVEAKDKALNDKINEIIGDLDSLGESDSTMTIVEICNKLKDLEARISANADAIATLNGDGEGSVKKAAADALADAKKYADDLNDAMDERVKDLEAIDHDKLAADAIAAVVAGAESDFDTLKEVADWIANDKTGAAALQVAVAKNTDNLDALETKVDKDIDNLTNHMTEAATALVEVDGRLDALESFVDAHESITIKEIESLFE
jgi:DNA repair exonuclease SbcCD ATPase subunit